MFELAAFLTSREDLKLVVRPTALGPAVLLLSGAVWGTLLLTELEAAVIGAYQSADVYAEGIAQPKAIDLSVSLIWQLSVSQNPLETGGFPTFPLESDPQTSSLKNDMLI